MVTKTSLEVEINAQNNTRGAFNGVRNDADRAFGKGAGGLTAIGLGAGAAIAGIGAAVLAMGTQLASASQTAARFETAMARVGALSGATGRDFEKLKAAAKELGSATTFSATQAAEGMQALAMAGFGVTDTIAAMPAVLAAAAAAQSDLGTTADLVSNIMSGFGIEASETGRIADVLTATFTSSNTTLESLGETMKFVGPIAKSQGQSLEDMAAAAGLLGSAGLQGSLAGTSLRGSLLRLSAPTEKVKGNLKDLGIVLRDNNGQMLPLPDLLSRVQGGIKNLDPSEQTKLLKELVGTEALSGFQVLLDAGPEKMRAYSAELENSLGRAAQIATQQTDTLEGSYKKLGSRWESLEIQIGERLNPIIKSFTDDALVPMVDAVTALIEKTEPQAKALTLVENKTHGVNEATGQLTVSFDTNRGSLEQLRQKQLSFESAAAEATDTVKAMGDQFYFASSGAGEAEGEIKKSADATEGLKDAAGQTAQKVREELVPAIRGDFVPALADVTIKTDEFKNKLADGPEGIFSRFVRGARSALLDPNVGLEASILNVFDTTVNGSLRQGLTAAAVAMGNLIAGPIGGAIAGAITRNINVGRSTQEAKGIVGELLRAGSLEALDQTGLKELDAFNQKEVRSQLKKEFGISDNQAADIAASLFLLRQGKSAGDIKAGDPVAFDALNAIIRDEVVKRLAADLRRSTQIEGIQRDLTSRAAAVVASGGNTTASPTVNVSAPASAPPPSGATASEALAYLSGANASKTLSRGKLRELGFNAVSEALNFFGATSFAKSVIRDLAQGNSAGWHNDIRKPVFGGWDVVAAQGFRGVVNKPTTILAGEAGPESVDITPLDGTATSGRRGGHVVNNFTINVSTPDAGSMARWVERDLFPMLQKQMIRAGRAGEGIVPQQAVMAA